MKCNFLSFFNAQNLTTQSIGVQKPIFTSFFLIVGHFRFQEQANLPGLRDLEGFSPDHQ
jgi:hypothetical protein